MSGEKPQEKTTQQKQTNVQKRCIIVKNSKVEDVAQRIASHVTMEQDGENVIVFSTQYKYRQQLIKDFGKENVELVESDKAKFASALAGQSKIAYAKFCMSNKELKDQDQILLIIRSSPRDANVEPAKEFVKNVVKICYEDNQEHTCKFFVRGWLIKELQELSKAGLIDKNQKETKQCRIFKRQDPWQKNLPYKRSIECRIFVKKCDVQEILDKLQEFQNKVTCTFSNPAKFAERRQEKKTDRRQKKANIAKKNDQRREKQQKKEKDINIELPLKKLTIFTESANVAKKLQETMKAKGFDLKIDNDKLYTESDVEKVSEFAKQIKINGKKLQMKLE